MPRKRPMRKSWNISSHFARNRWISIVIIVLLIFIPILWTVEQNIDPVLMHIAVTEVKKEAQAAITKGIEQQVRMGEELNQLIQVQKAEDGRIVSVQLEPLTQAKIYTNSAKEIEKSMAHLKDKPIEISLGQVMQSTMFADFGPDIPVRMWQEGSAKISLEPKLQAQGINMVLITVNLVVQTELGIIVPFNKEMIQFTTSYPIAQTMVVGEVPSYYYNSEDGKHTGNQPALPPIEKKNEH
ncbi:sporulation protein YunB [Thermoactinomyces sp. DSM 45892]|uniref:sporulation protein YunB n=1 Tax=Thermoactinomyces sp. DSM 45892 TaxID=1882753 RepID=UPI00089C459A|nr:sporulation protein YunB [Thermoactinomyces sp. DSM 45892]SDZ28356.1 sporulation protein YunB [Thermoactinomyces sp. DSM 45892]